LISEFSQAAGTVRGIGVWARGQKEPWWLATDLNLPIHRIASFYDRRMGIEEQIRDSKGCRFGIKLFWTQIQEPDHLARFMMILAFALLLLTAIGKAILKIIPAVLETPEREPCAEGACPVPKPRGPAGSVP